MSSLTSVHLTLSRPWAFCVANGILPIPEEARGVGGTDGFHPTKSALEI
jgi:hypothetical protein